VEAAMMSLDIAPGLGAKYWGCKGWKQQWDHRMWATTDWILQKNALKTDPAELGCGFQGTDHVIREADRGGSSKAFKRAGNGWGDRCCNGAFPRA